MKKKLLVSLALALTLALTFMTAAPVLAWWEFDTTVSITGPEAPVEPGTTVTLTITETNTSVDGNPAELWISPAWVILNPGGLELNKANYYVSGDDGNDGILDVGETWLWQVDVLITEETTFEAIGHGLAQGDPDWDVTWGVLDDEDNMAFPNERAEFTVYVTPPPDGEGFTPGYWKARKHQDDWVPTGYSQGDSFFSVFGAGPTPDITLLEAVKTGGGGERALIRHGTAALLNAAHPGVDYPLTEGQVIAMVFDAYFTGDFAGVKDILAEHNELGGDM